MTVGELKQLLDCYALGDDEQEVLIENADCDFGEISGVSINQKGEIFIY